MDFTVFEFMFVQVGLSTNETKKKKRDLKYRRLVFTMHCHLRKNQEGFSTLAIAFIEFIYAEK